jgi:hydrogenase maturation protein HypF
MAKARDRKPQCRSIGEHDVTVAVATTIERLHITIQGAVQGVGFRPTVYRLASRLCLGGWVRNTSVGLEIEVEGSSQQLEVFARELEAERPEAAVVTTSSVLRIAPSGSVGFEILPSEQNASAAKLVRAGILPDLSTCPACLQDVLDPSNRRFGYPFANCTLCGPRFTIQLDIPYDRSNTTMSSFMMCSECRHEYDSYQDRRFHAQPNACSVCGPRLRLYPEDTTNPFPLASAAQALALGFVVALKGIGGFQLLVDARNSTAVKRLRVRKQREAKPFALLMPTIERVRSYCEVSADEEKLLQSQAAPIVLLQPLVGHDLALEVAPTSPRLGVMLPCSPLHHLLMEYYPFPVVATSGNLSGEPIAITNEEAVARLEHIADIFVLHDRAIARPCDDSVVRYLKAPQLIRRARGYAPLPVLTPRDLRPVLAVGGHLKNTVAIALGRQVHLSQHIGDLDSLEAREAFEQTIEDLCKLYRFQPELIVSDLHPDYASTKWARERARSLGLPLIQVQHHHAHVAGCAAENGLETDYLGVAWDGAGLGLDGTIWGSEFFLAGPSGLERIGHLRQFPLPGGETAMRDCSRPAAGILWGTLGEERASQAIAPGILRMLEHELYTPKTSSMGRLFDAVAYLAGVATRKVFEGQAAIRLENIIGRTKTDDSYELAWKDDIGNWAPLIEQVLVDVKANLGSTLIAAKFHNALANWIVAVARTTRVRDVVLSGGVFQNAYLTERSMLLLKSDGFRVFTHHQVPANDGGLSLGQAVLAGQLN